MVREIDETQNKDINSNIDMDVDIDIMPILYYLCYLVQVQLIYGIFLLILELITNNIFILLLIFQFILLNYRHPEIEEVEISAMKDMFNYAEKQGWIQK